MKTRRVLIIVIPFLFLFSLIFFATMPKILQRQEQNFQSARKQGWTTYFGEEDDCGGGVWGEGNKIITDAAGKKHSLADERGQVVVLHFWGTTCEHCLTSMPKLEKLAANWRKKCFATPAWEITTQAVTGVLMLYFAVRLLLRMVAG